MYPLPASRFASLLSDLGSPTSDLPVREALPVLAAALAAHNRAVLVAPPGAGKTTLVPLALLDAPWRQDGRVIVLEPRRLAARAAAARMAHLIGERVGETVGYRVRMDAAVSARTRVEVVTEGPYRFSRNPMYVGLSLLYVGIALWTHALWALPLLPLVLWGLWRRVIRREERYLAAAFGADYAAYTRRVRRWL
jgi:hypothetical protein